MNVLKGILKESQEYYQRLQKEIKKKIEQLPKGSVKKRNINGKLYYYLQYRENSKIKHKYLGKIYEDDMALLFLEIKDVPSFKRITVKNTILTDMYSEQKNLVHVAFKGTTKSLILNKDKQEDVLNFKD